jgi:hypothetical protein
MDILFRPCELQPAAAFFSRLAGKLLSWIEARSTLERVPGLIEPFILRHGRACPGHPRLST